MTETKERKKKTASGDQGQRVQQMSVGEILRRARLERGLGLEQVSSAINIRVAQLRALEEGNIDALPGMTYALGFAQSYAKYLHLNGGEIVHKFKAEHGGVQKDKPEFHLPEPHEESKMPNPQILAIAGAFVVLLLVLWAVFSGGSDEDAQMTTQIPPPPAVQPLSEMASVPLFPDSTTGTVIATLPMDGVAVTAAAEEPAAETPVIAPPSALPESEAVKVEEVAAPIKAVVEASSQVEPLDVAVLAAKVKKENQPKPIIQQPEKAPEDSVISISRGKGRIMLQSVQSSWIQVSDARENVIFKKVLRPGEQYFVPNEKGITLVTSNAGGLEIYVDGNKVQSLGKTGDILRGVAMDPQELKKTKIKVRN